jgi:hypothetical protein
VLAGLVAAAVAAGMPNDARWVLFGLLGALWLAFAAAAREVFRLPARRAVPLVVAGGIALQAIAAAVPPRSTDDFYRYAWDGRVQAAGIDPYHYRPTDPALAALRDGWLFPPGCRVPEPPCTVINHPQSPTIYPPVAQAWFLAVHALSPPGSRHKPWQLAAGLLAVLTTLALVRVLRRAGQDPRWAVLWAWCPAVVLEAGNAGHVDVLGALLAVAALGLLAARRAVAGGTLLGAAVAVKLYPALVLPAVLRRRGATVLAAAGAVVAASYLPHLAAVGGRVLGYLPGYLSEEGYAGTGRFPVIRLLVPPGAAPYLAAAVLAGTALLVARRADPDRPWAGAVVLAGTTLLVAGPSYPWYPLLLVSLVALSGRWEWLPAAAAAYPPYFAGALHLPPEPTKLLSYATAMAAVAVLATARRRHRPTVPARQVDVLPRPEAGSGRCHPAGLEVVTGTLKGDGRAGEWSARARGGCGTGA